MSTKQVFIGVDPGTQGGITALVVDGGSILKVEIYQLSKMTERDIVLSLRRFAPRMKGEYRWHVHCVIEKSQPMPRQGVSSTFKYGTSYGFLRASLVAAGIPFEECGPKKWQKHLSMYRKATEKDYAWKKRLKQKAQQLFPDAHIVQETGDSALIAYYTMATS